MKEQEIKNWIFLILFAIISFYLINNLTIIWTFISNLLKVFAPIILGGVIAFILNIPMTKIENLIKKKFKNKKYNTLIRIVSIIISLIIFISLIGLLLFLIVPELATNIESLINNIPSLVKDTENFLLQMLNKYPEIQINIKEIFMNLNTSKILSDTLNYILNSSLGFISSFISSLVTLFMGLIFAIYILIQKEYLSKCFKKLLYAFLNKTKVSKIIEVSKLSNKTFSKFISGQCLDAVILGTILFVVLSIFKFPYALLISVLTTITALIPIFGALIAMVVGAILIGINNPLHALAFIVIFQIVQQIEGNLIYPRVVGSSVGLSPLWTLLAITIGGNLCGITGMILGLPLASICYAFLRTSVNNKLKQKEIEVI